MRAYERSVSMGDDGGWIESEINDIRLMRPFLAACGVQYIYTCMRLELGWVHCDLTMGGRWWRAYDIKDHSLSLSLYMNKRVYCTLHKTYEALK